MQNFISGQRWISQAEPQLGLGILVGIEPRSVTIHFPSVDETRVYARETAPLTRIVFAPGDHVHGVDGITLTVESVENDAGLLTYRGHDQNGQAATLSENHLDSAITLSRPSERLFNGQIDQDKWFELRYQTLQQFNRLCHSELRGLTGGRTSLIPHQLYIGHEVANRFAPRVLLADEVGLGKTIEAGMIVHHQLLSERAQRILIIVPESLVHQWLVEMLRRFNLYFSLFDEERCLAIEDHTPDVNPFFTEQLVLCSLEFITSHPQRYQQIESGEWDLLVVDEAHHLQWSPTQASREYQCIERLAGGARGVLLLTATPEQLGKASHYARLRLLDPDRFADFDTFLAEEESYQPIAHAIEALLTQPLLDTQSMALIRSTLAEGDNEALLASIEASDRNQEEARAKLIEHLLDRHGTGRVLFRNTRDTIKGFPQRRAIAYPLPLPAPYHDHTVTDSDDIQTLLRPESRYRRQSGSADQSWLQFDPRIDWLCTLLGRLKTEKVLIIASAAATAADIANYLNQKAITRAALFHENLTIIERDRAAAYFADAENGCQALVCSEIGSEGRNFQFAHHLVLFDLPLNPDLLEQRIGRLDRIGQSQTITLHIPYLEHSAQAVMYHWYHDGLDAFEHTSPAGLAVYQSVETELHEALRHPGRDIAALIDISSRRHREFRQVMHDGRDRLLEYNSCRPAIADRLIKQARLLDSTSTLAAYMESVCDCFGVDYEEHSTNRYILRPGNHMLTRLTGLPDDGMTLTFDRDTALACEDIAFLSWEHPLVTAAMAWIMESEQGNTAVTAVHYDPIKAGTVLMECIYVIQGPPDSERQNRRYLPPTTIRIVLDEHGGNHSATLTHELISDGQLRVDSATANKIVRVKQAELKSLLQNCEAAAQRETPALLADARQSARDILMTEIDRLQALKLLNPTVRQEEIDYYNEQLARLNNTLAVARLELDAIRVIVTT